MGTLLNLEEKSGILWHWRIRNDIQVCLCSSWLFPNKFTLEFWMRRKFNCKNALLPLGELWITCSNATFIPERGKASLILKTGIRKLITNHFWHRMLKCCKKVVLVHNLYDCGRIFKILFATESCAHLLQVVLDALVIKTHHNFGELFRFSLTHCVSL